MAEQTEVLAQAPKPIGPITTSAQAYEAQRQLIPEVAQAEADVKKAEAEVESFRIGERAKAAEDYATKVRGETARTQKMLDESPFPQFEPTKENAQSLGELFSLTATFGLLLGNMGKTSSLGAMNAMTGMLGGWRQGRMDLFNKEKAEFDKNLGVMKVKHEEYKKDLEQYLKLAATDRDAANAKADEMAAKLGSQSVPGTYARLRDRKGMLDQLAAQAKVLEKMEEKQRQAEERRQDRLETARRHREDMAQRAAQHRETLAAPGASQVFQGSDGNTYAFDPKTKQVVPVAMPEGVTLTKPGAGGGSKKDIKTAADGSLILVDRSNGLAEPVKDAQGNAVKAPNKKEAQSALLARPAENIREAFVQAAKDIENITLLPTGTMMGSFSSMAGKSGEDLTSALRNQLVRSELTDKEQRFLQQLTAAVEGHLAFALGGGYASSTAKSRMDQYKEQVARAGDDPAVATMMLARFRQELNVLAENFPTKPGVTKEMSDAVQKANERINKAVPFTVEDVIKAEFGPTQQRQPTPAAPGVPSKPADVPGNAQYSPSQKSWWWQENDQWKSKGAE